MRLSQRVPGFHARVLVGGLGMAGGLVVGGCTPDEVQAPVEAPKIGIEAAVTPTTGLVGEWKLNEAGGTTAADSKNGFDAAVRGGAAFVPGKIGNALNLNNGTAGTGGKYADMPSNSTLDNLQEANYTISAWFHPYSVPANSVVENRNWAIVAKQGHHMGLFYESGGRFSARHYLTGEVQLDASSSASYPVNAWYHVAGVVSKTGGTVKVYVNGALAGTTSFTPNTATREYGTVPFKIGRARIHWAADGKVDQVRIYNRALSDGEVADLFNETEGQSFRFPVGMFKGTQLSLLGMARTPDGHLTTGSVSGLTQTLDSARAAGARVVMRVTGGNENFQTNGDRRFVLNKWKAAFDRVNSANMSGYLADGTLIGHYAIDEPYADFDNMHSGFLEQMCAYQKSFAGWRDVPCIIRDKNTRLHDDAPVGGYQHVDAGWAQLTDHHYIPPATGYNGNMLAYFQDNLSKGRQVGLGLMYGFNLLNGGREFAGCARPADPANCALTATEVRQMADALASLGNDQGCGVIGWVIDQNPGPERDYFFGTGQYSGNGIPSALQYLNGKVGGLRPGPCDWGG